MVCDRCKMVVKAELEKTGLHVTRVILGEIELKESELSPDQLSNAKTRLGNVGFELIDDRKTQIIEQIKIAIIELIHYQDDEIKIKHSEYLAQHLNYDYSFLSKTFSDEEGITIEQYIIHQKIEKVKELLAYGQLTLSEIAWQMGYSSVAALSSQFKKVVGVTTSEFKKGSDKSRNTLDKVGKE